MQACDHSRCELDSGGMVCVTMKPVEGQDSFWDHQTPEFVRAGPGAPQGREQSARGHAEEEEEAALAIGP